MYLGSCNPKSDSDICFTDVFRLQAMPNQPPVPFPAPQALPAVSPELTNVSLDDLGFFSTIEQEETSNQLGTKVS